MNIKNLVYTLNQWYGRKTIVLVMMVVGALIYIGLRDKPDSASDTSAQPVIGVRTSSAAALADNETLSLIGTVRSASEATLKNERSGTITGVYVKLGDRVNPGQVLIEFSNADERAALLQAEGAYDAALASAASAGIGVNEAKTALQAAQRSAINSITSAYNTVNNVLLSDIDRFFSSPDSQLPGLRILGRGYTKQLNDERIAYQSILSAWQTRTQKITLDSDLGAELVFADQQVKRTITFVDTFITVFSLQPTDASAQYSEAELAGFKTAFTNIKTGLLGIQASLDGTASALTSASDGVARASISASGGGVSVSDAQAKQALGVLRAAQANYEKTRLRSPIGGTVNALEASVGRYVPAMSDVVSVANNRALEVVVYVNDADKDQFLPGSDVSFASGATGTVSVVSPVIDPVTKKVEVRIGSSDTRLTSGQTVRVFATAGKQSTGDPTRVRVPLSAVRLDHTTGYVLLVVNDVLEKRTVTVGQVRGGSIEILDGLTPDEEFVIDARGLSAGSQVEIIN